MRRRDIPEPWGEWLVSAGYVDPRTRDARPSARRLADFLEVSTTTIMNMMHGAADTEPETVEAVAEALRVDVRTVFGQVGRMRSERAPYVPPAEVNLLSRRQQRALSELILAMAEERESGGNTAAIVATESDAETVVTDSELPKEGPSPRGRGRRGTVPP